MSVYYYLSLRSYAYQVTACSSVDDSTIKNLNTMCEDINQKEMVLHRAMAWDVKDNVIYYALGFITAGVSFLFTPFFRYHIIHRNCSRIKIGNFRCRMKWDLYQFTCEVIIPPLLIDIYTLGCYSLLGFGMWRENTFYDNNIEWYYDDSANMDSDYIFKKRKTKYHI